MRKILLYSFLFFSCHSYSQTPGYLGRKLSVSYSPAFFLSLQPMYKNSFDDYGTKPGLNFRNDLTIDYVVSKSVSLGGSLKYLSTKISDAFYYPEYSIDQSIAYAGDIKLNGPSFSVYIKKFAFRKKGFIAPVGFYSKWEIFYSNVAVRSGKLLSIEDSTYNLVTDISEITSYNHQKVYGLIFSYGRQNFITDQIFINTASSIGISNMGISSAIGGSYYHSVSELPYDVQTRFSGYLFFNFNIGIGILL